MKVPPMEVNTSWQRGEDVYTITKVDKLGARFENTAKRKTRKTNIPFFWVSNYGWKLSVFKELKSVAFTKIKASLLR